MNTIRVRCPADGVPYLVPEEMLGRRFRCPQCDTVFEVVRPVSGADESLPEPAARLTWEEIFLYGLTLFGLVATVVVFVSRWGFGVDLLR